ncbi:MAG: histidine kinase dimerization/phospho-acceptor domain-containing protein [Bacteroidota bacterium]|nr:histidine kinase dimerization/phospho-acceptor domain-containing protein [Bacteroidota bacterium]
MNRRIVSMQTNQNTGQGDGQMLNMELYIAKLGEMDTPEIPEIIEDTPLSFIAALAHEVRNPLTCINFCTELLKSDTSEKKKVIYIDIINRSTSKIDNLIYNLVTYKEADGGQTKNIHYMRLLMKQLKLPKTGSCSKISGSPGSLLRITTRYY